MGLPKVTIERLNGQLGRIRGTDDSVMGMILSGVAVVDGIQLLAPVELRSVNDAAALGINAAYDTVNSLVVYRQVQDFYTEATPGTVLWLMLVSSATTLADMLSATGSVARMILDAAGGRINLLGIDRVPAPGYTPGHTAGIDPDAVAAIAAGQVLAEQERVVRQSPIGVVVGGRDLVGALSGAADLKAGSAEFVQVCVDGLGAGSKQAAIGRLLGRYASIPVERNIGRVKDGERSVAAAYLTNGLLNSAQNNALDGLHDKGYVFLRQHRRRGGWYYNDDPTATTNADDYSSMARVRVANKAERLIIDSLTDELLDEVPVDAETGRLEVSRIKALEQDLAGFLRLGLGEAVSSAEVEIDLDQPVLATDELRVAYALVGKGKLGNIKGVLGFSPGGN